MQAHLPFIVLISNGKVGNFFGTVTFPITLRVVWSNWNAALTTIVRGLGSEPETRFPRYQRFFLKVTVEHTWRQYIGVQRHVTGRSILIDIDSTMRPFFSSRICESNVPLLFSYRLIIIISCILIFNNFVR